MLDVVVVGVLSEYGIGLFVLLKMCMLLRLLCWFVVYMGCGMVSW